MLVANVGSKRKALFERIRPFLARGSWSIGEQAVSPVVQMVLTPCILSWIGIDAFGTWTFVLSFVAIGQLISCGAGVATIKHVAADLGEERPDRAVLAIRAAVTVVALGGLGMCLGTAACGEFLMRRFFLRMGDPGAMAHLLTAGVALMALQELDNIFASALRGAQRFDASARVEFVTRISWGVGLAFTAYLFKSVTALVFAAILLTTVKAVAKALIVSRLFARPCYLPSFNRPELKRVIEFGKWQWVQSISGILLSVADRFLVGGMFGTSILGSYGVCLQFAQYVHGLPAAGMQVILPWVSSRTSRGQPIERETINKILFAGGIGVAAIAITATLFAPVLLSLWISPAFAAKHTTVFRVLIAAYGILGIAIPTHYVLLGIGEVRFVSLCNVVAGGLVVAGSVVLAKYGLVGFASAKLMYGPITFLNYWRIRQHFVSNSAIGC